MHHDLGLLIGSESGGSYSCNGCVGEYLLPNTRIALQCARCVFSTRVNGMICGEGIMPDIEIEPAVEDLITGRDTILHHALGIIAKSRTGESLNESGVRR